MTTILDYINETNDVCQNIINNSKDITKSFVDLLMTKDIKEIVIVGSGTSCHAGLVAKPLFEEVGNIRTSALFPNVFIEQASYYDKQTLVIGASQSGASMSTLNALKRANELGMVTLAMSTFDDSIVSNEAHAFVPIVCGEEKAVAKTKGYTATVVTLYLAMMEYAKEARILKESDYELMVAKLSETIHRIPTIIKQSESWYNKNQEAMNRADSIIIVASSKQMGTLMESTLKLIETVRIPVMGYELEEFMHGIYNAITSNSFLLYLATDDDHLNRMLELKNYLARKTDKQYAIVTKTHASSEHDCIIDAVNDHYFRSLEYIIPIQILCHYLPLLKGINPFISGDPEFHKTLKSKIL